MQYSVIRIDEDIDFGCEERPEGYQPTVVVTLKDEADQTITIRQPDQMLYDRDINEGDVVLINAAGELEKYESKDSCVNA